MEFGIRNIESRGTFCQDTLKRVFFGKNSVSVLIAALNKIIVLIKRYESFTNNLRITL